MSKHQSDLIEACFHSNISRRDFCNRLVKLGIIGAIPSFISNAVVTRALPAPAPDQNEWRHCNKCRSLFYNGYRRKGRCPVTRDHVYDEYSAESANRDYALTYNSPGPGQRDWRFCYKCEVLFFNGYLRKGVCAAGGGHVAAGYNFVLSPKGYIY